MPPTAQQQHGCGMIGGGRFASLQSTGSKASAQGYADWRDIVVAPAASSVGSLGMDEDEQPQQDAAAAPGDDEVEMEVATEEGNTPQQGGKPVPSWEWAVREWAVCSYA